ncbi:Centrosomal protein of 95 kDa [Thoreauomyces humboldtii]|nr:Centrosomal protein of 95 kDa [Thoreauomyces humboldtii]
MQDTFQHGLDLSPRTSDEQYLTDTVNRLLSHINVPIQVSSFSDCVPSLWVALFEGLFHMRISDVIRGTPSKTRRARVHNVQCVVDELANTLLHTDLNHISSEGLVSGDARSIRYLIEIFGEVGKLVMGMSGDPPAEERSPRRKKARTDHPEWDRDEQPRDGENWDGFGQSFADFPDDCEDIGVSEIEKGPYDETYDGPDHSFEDPPTSSGMTGADAAPEKRRRRVRSGSCVLTDVTDDVEEFLRSRRSMADEASGYQNGWRSSTGEKAEATRPTPRKTSTKSTKNIPQSRSRKPPDSSSSPVRSCEERRRRRTDSYGDNDDGHRRSDGGDDDEEEDDDGESRGSHPLAEENLKQFQRTIDLDLPGADVSTAVPDSVWRNQVRTWEKALDDRLWSRKVEKHRQETRARTELRPLVQRARTVGDDLFKVGGFARATIHGNCMLRAYQIGQTEPQLREKGDDGALRTANAAVYDQRRRVINLEKRQREAEDEVRKHQTKLREADELRVKHLHKTYQEKQRAAIIEFRREQKEAERALGAAMRRKQEAKDSFNRDQLDILTEQLQVARKEEDIVVKAHAEELRKIRREQKHEAKLHIARVKEKLQVDVDDLVFREADAAGIVDSLQFGVSSRSSWSAKRS